MPDVTPEHIAAFITRWENSGAAERANSTLFLAELCILLELPSPDPASRDNAQNAYVFERAVVRKNLDGSTSTGFIDLYRRGYFVLESKQGHNAPGETETAAAGKVGHGKRGTQAFDKALERAFHQARGYITALPVEEGRPPFLIVCDVGHSLDLYAEFTATGGQYERFPDPVSHRITLPDLHRQEIRDRLRAVWLDPHSLDPSKIAAKVTRDIAGRLATLAKSLEADGHHSHVIAGFLQRSLFTMFAEDIGLLPEDGFKNLLDRVKETPRGFPVLVSTLWKEMATGTEYSSLLFKEIACFNGGLFETTTALPLSAAQLNMLADAAATDWSGVEPSIFGTLLTRALDPRERHKLGAEFTPRAYVERLIRPTIIGPLREQWDAVRIAAVTLHDEADQLETQADNLQAQGAAQLSASPAEAKRFGTESTRLRKDAKKKDAEALAQVITFHRHLCKIRVLDPACGTANFLYVTMEHMKRIEAEVIELITGLGGDAGMEMHGFRVRPEQFIGLELNKQAVAIGELVLWIGYFQWQRKTTGKADTGDRPLLPKDRSIFEQDAVLDYDERIPRRDPDTGEILTIWDGHTTKPHPITGKEVPDESARTVLFDYKNPRRAEWPQADYIVGNPPFLGNKRMREGLGDGYVEALREAWKKSKPNSWDFVMFWWRQAAELVHDATVNRFGFITTNSIQQTSNRGVIESALGGKNPLRISYAVPDHPWVDSADGAAVRIAMTVADRLTDPGLLERVVGEHGSSDGEVQVIVQPETGVVGADLKVGASSSQSVSLKANEGVCFQGMNLVGEGFRVTEEEIRSMGYSINALPACIRSYQKGRELLQGGGTGWVLDCFGLTADELLEQYTPVYQHLFVHVKPERDHNNRKSRRENWWIFGEPVGKLRKALRGVSRYIATVETSKFKPFVFIPVETIPDHKLYAIASDDAWLLGCLSAAPHQLWAIHAGGTLEDRPTWTNTTTFRPFPFPALEEGPLKQRIRDLGERLDAHRKRQQELHPDLTLTGIYNVLEKLRTGETLTAKDKDIHDKGLVSVLKQIHDDLDAAVLEAYGWLPALDGPFPLADRMAEKNAHAEAIQQEILTRLVALNHERAAEEKRGLIRYLRPDYQAPAVALTAPALPGTETADSPAAPATSLPAEILAWPADLPAQVAAVRKLLPTTGQDPEALAACFGRKAKKRTDQIIGILATLKALGHIV